MVKIELGKRDSVWIVALVVLIGVGFVYGYVTDGSGDPSVMGHSVGEIVVDNTLCKQITGHDCGFDNNGSIPTPVPASIDYETCSNIVWAGAGNCPTDYVLVGGAYRSSDTGEWNSFKCCKLA